MRFSLCEKCKYNFDGECEFYSMGSGNDIDKPCFGEEELVSRAASVDEIKLKPCPFCGKTDTVYVIHEGSDFFVACDYRQGGCGASASIKKEEYSAIKAWNRRVNDG